MKFVALEYAWTKDGKRKPVDPPLHIYEAEPPTFTLCARKVPTEAYGWFATGCPLADPAFPLGPICPECARRVTESGESSPKPDSTASTGQGT